MPTTILALQDLSCGHCVKNVNKALEAVAGVESVNVSLHYAKVTGEVTAQNLIDAVVNAGYQAQVAATPDLHLELQGLSCGHCVKNTEKALSAVENVDAFEVTKTEAKIYGSVDANTVIQAIVEAGYEAVLAGTSHPKINLLSETSNQTEITPDPVIVENNDEDQVVLLLEGLSCAACVLKVEKALQAVAQVSQARVNLAEQTALIFGNAEPQQLINAVVNAGYGAQLIENEEERRQKQQQQTEQESRLRKRQAILALVVGFAVLGFALAGDKVMVNAQSQTAWLVIAFITLCTMLYTGGHFYQRAWRSLRNKTTTMDTLVSLGTGVAWLYSLFVTLNYDFFPESARHVYFEASVMLIGFINLGKMLEVRAKQKSSKALERLLDLTPATARVVEPQGEREIPLAEVKQGMTLRLQTGDRVSVDGQVLQGNAWLDESMLTGEALPIEKQQGDKVSAGTLVTDGFVLFKAEQIGRHTRLAGIIRLVRQAQSSKPQIGQLVDKIASIFVPVVLSIAILAALIWYMVGPEPQLAYSLVVLTTVLIIACPCSLGLAVPMSIIAGVGRAAELGILVRDADALQKAAKIDTVVFDKTGTLTQGKPKVTALCTFNQISEKSAVQFAAILEQGANHPLAKAILALAEEQQISVPQNVAQFRTLKGLGVSGKIEDKTLLLGNQTLLQQQGIATEQADDWVKAENEKGATTVFLAIDQTLAAVFAIRDPLRQDSIAAVQRLHQQGYHLVMLTGDQPRTAQAIAKELGLDQVIANVLPEGKAQAIINLQQQGRQIMMVGDGINDAPALAQANVSMAMGSGSDIAIETADLTLMRQSIHSVVDALSLAKGILRNMKENLFGAFVYNAIGIPIAAGVLYPFLGVLLSPIFAGIAMALSSITVATNANRLLWFKP